MSKRSGRIAQRIASALETKFSSDNLSRSSAIHLAKQESLQFYGFDVAASASFHRTGPHSREIYQLRTVRSYLSVMPYGTAGTSLE